MKKLKAITTVLFLFLILGSMPSCEVERHAESGRHRGWFHRNNDEHHEKGAVIIIEKDHRDHRSDDDRDRDHDH